MFVLSVAGTTLALNNMFMRRRKGVIMSRRGRKPLQSVHCFTPLRLLLPSPTPSPSVHQSYSCCFSHRTRLSHSYCTATTKCRFSRSVGLTVCHTEIWRQRVYSQSNIKLYILGCVCVQMEKTNNPTFQSKTVWLFNDRWTLCFTKKDLNLD